MAALASIEHSTVFLREVPSLVGELEALGEEPLSSIQLRISIGLGGQHGRRRGCG